MTTWNTSTSRRCSRAARATARPTCTSPPGARRSCASTATSCRSRTTPTRSRRSGSRQTAFGLMTEGQRQEFDEHGEVDLAHATAGHRTIPHQRLPPARLDRDRAALHPRPRVLARRARRAGDRPRPRAAAARARAADRSDRLGQVDDPDGDGRHHQPARARAHHHDRRPDRVPPREQAGAHPPARGRRATPTRSPRRCAGCCARTPTSILIGELRDPESISTALSAAETGHLVLSTLHTQGAAKSINRIIDVFPADQQHQIRTQLGDTLQGVISQTLMPLSQTNGRTIATEVLINTPAVANMIREGQVAQLYSAMQAGSAVGMHTLDQDLRRLVSEGTIALQRRRGLRGRPEEPRRRARAPPRPRRRGVGASRGEWRQADAAASCRERRGRHRHRHGVAVRHADGRRPHGPDRARGRLGRLGRGGADDGRRAGVRLPRGRSARRSGRQGHDRGAERVGRHRQAQGAGAHARSR